MLNGHRNYLPIRSLAALFLAVGLLSPAPSQAGGKEPPAEQRLSNYVGRARAWSAASTPSVGSLWSSQGLFSDLVLDYKARKVNDLIVIHIIEQTTAEAAGSVQSQRDFEANSGISGLLGIVGERSGLRTLFSPASGRGLSGRAQTASDTRLTTTLAGHVVEVLPNGNMVVEAAREVEMNGERQILLVRGIVRPGDVAPDNSVLSTAISHLEVELKGEGVVSDSVRRPNVILRGLLRVLGF